MNLESTENRAKGSRYRGDASVSQGKAKMTSKPLQARREAWDGSLLPASGRSQPCRLPDLGAVSLSVAHFTCVQDSVTETAWDPA